MNGTNTVTAIAEAKQRLPLRKLMKKRKRSGKPAILAEVDWHPLYFLPQTRAG
jgi:hypothetical protein